MQRETALYSGRLPTFCDFNPLPLCRGRRQPSQLKGGIEIFQSTPSMQRETDNGELILIDDGEFQSTPSMQRETARGCIYIPRLLHIVPHFPFSFKLCSELH